jgi:hypothetical protein
MRLEARIRRLEQAAVRHPFREHPEFNAVLRCRGYFELLRFGAALRAGMNGEETRAEEADRLLALGCERLVNGWTDSDKVALDKQDRDKKQVLWEFMKALGLLSNGCYLDTGRFDLLDVTETEIKQLTEAAQRATCASDFNAVADIVGRLSGSDSSFAGELPALSSVASKDWRMLIESRHRANDSRMSAYLSAGDQHLLTRIKDKRVQFYLAA